MNTKLLFTHALTPLHPGTGQGVGVIDMPVARETATGLPFLPGSSLKGVLRDNCTHADIDKIFGTPSDVSGSAGAAQFTDQRLLLLPVRSLSGVFAWVTSPFVLQRFARDVEMVAGLDQRPSQIKIQKQTEARIPKGSNLTVEIDNAKQIVLEDLNLNADKPKKSTRLWAEWLAEVIFTGASGWEKTMTEHFCVVHDDVFSYLLETATEIIARNRLEEDSKTVAKGGLWYEEALPAESILYGLVLGRSIGQNGLSPDDLVAEVKILTKDPLQFGGHASIGRGLCSLTLVE